MTTSRTNSRAAIALLLGLAGLCAAPPVAQAQQQPRLLFLGISKDGRAHQAAESAVKLRLAGLDVLVVQPKEIPDPPCERAECLAAALAAEHADFALSGRILKNERACLATLWLTASRGREKILEQDIACHPEGRDSELGASLADGAAMMVEDYIRNMEPAPALSDTIPSLVAVAQVSNSASSKPHWNWNWKRKTAVAILGIAFASSLTITSAFAALNKKFACSPGEPCITNIITDGSHLIISGKTYDYDNATITTGIATGAFAIGFSITLLMP